MTTPDFTPLDNPLYWESLPWRRGCVTWTESTEDWVDPSVLMIILWMRSVRFICCSFKKFRGLCSKVLTRVLWEEASPDSFGFVDEEGDGEDPSLFEALNFLWCRYASSISILVLTKGGAWSALFSIGISSMLSCFSFDSESDVTSLTFSSKADLGLEQTEVVGVDPLQCSFPDSIPESVGESTLLFLLDDEEVDEEEELVLWGLSPPA